MRLTIAILMLFLGVAMAHDTSTAGKVDAKHMKAWEKLGDEFLDQLYRFHPTYATGDGLVFGNEESGAPDWLHAEFGDAQRLRIPHANAALRSLNLSTAAGIATYEALRQVGLPRD